MGPQPKPSPKNHDGESTNITAKGLSNSKGYLHDLVKPELCTPFGLESTNHLCHFSAKLSKTDKSSARDIQEDAESTAPRWFKGSLSTRSPCAATKSGKGLNNLDLLGSPIGQIDNKMEYSRLKDFASPLRSMTGEESKEEARESEYRVQYAGKTYDMADEGEFREFFKNNLNDSGQKSLFRKNYDKINKMYSVMLK